MKLIRGGTLLIGLLAVAGAAQAQLSSTITATSDYDFRGFSQTAKDPALQASLDYSFPQGVAIGAWASNVDFGNNDADIELDLYAGYTGAIGENLSWTAGLVYYTYPGSDDTGDYPEFYAGFGAGMFSFKQWYSDNFYDTDVEALYTEANVDIPLGETNFSLQLHGGYSWGDFWEDHELFDYSVGVTYPVNNFNLNLKLTGTDASGDDKITGDVGNNEARAIFTVSTTLPWGE